jgi:hypothetical protein
MAVFSKRAIGLWFRSNSTPKKTLLQDCNGPDKTDIDNPSLLQSIKDSKARIITIAFGYALIH